VSEQFGNSDYSRFPKGSVDAVVVLLLWLFISARVALLGAANNAEME